MVTTLMPPHAPARLTVLKDGQRTEPNGPTDIRSALQRSVLFSCLPEYEIAKLAKLVRRFVMEPGPIFLEGDVSSNTYLLVSGRVDISVFSSDGRELQLYRLGPGDFFGEMALLDHQPRSSSAIARTRCEIILISRSTLQDTVAHNPDLALRMIASLSQRLRTADETIKAISFLDMTSRLARALLEMEKEQGRRGMVRASQSELANAVGCMRQSVTRTIATWRRLGYVTTSRGYIRIVNRRKLQAYSQW